MKKLCLILAIALLLVACAGPTPTAPPPLAEGYDEYIEEPDYSYEVFEDYLMDGEYLPEEDDYPELDPDIPVEGPSLQTGGQAIPEQPQAQGGSPQHGGAVMPEEPTGYPPLRQTSREMAEVLYAHGLIDDIESALAKGDDFLMSVLLDVPAAGPVYLPPVITQLEAEDIATDHMGGGQVQLTHFVAGRADADQSGTWVIILVLRDDEYTVWVTGDTGEVVHTERLR